MTTQPRQHRVLLVSGFLECSLAPGYLFASAVRLLPGRFETVTGFPDLAYQRSQAACHRHKLNRDENFVELTSHCRSMYATAALTGVPAKREPPLNAVI